MDEITEQTTVTLRPVTMICPNDQGIRAPSRLGLIREMTYAEFLERYADRPHAMLVSFDPDGVSDPVWMTAYGFGFDCWWIVAGNG